MEKSKSISRRKLIGNAFKGIGGLGAVALSAKAVAKTCLEPTPRQGEGPFYPVRNRADENWDLTQVGSNAAKAKGEHIFVSGRVVDQNCKPVENALVEIWQANVNGRYDHPADRDPSRPLDPNFQYWGQVLTVDTGEFLFKTIYPGAYPASRTWTRTPHIHFKVEKRGYQNLTSQWYFEGEKLNKTDLIVQSLSKTERDNVVLKDGGVGVDKIRKFEGKVILKGFV